MYRGRLDLHWLVLGGYLLPPSQGLFAPHLSCPRSCHHLLCTQGTLRTAVPLRLRLDPMDPSSYKASDLFPKPYAHFVFIPQV